MSLNRKPKHIHKTRIEPTSTPPKSQFFHSNKLPLILLFHMRDRLQ